MRTLSIFLLGLSLSAVAPAADGLLITNVASPGVVKGLIADYGLRYLDETVGGPFVLFAVEESRADAVQAAMMTDPRVVWVEDDAPLDSPEGLDQRPEDIRARVGGTIPAIFDQAAGVEFNSEWLQRINWQQTPFGRRDRTVRVAVLDTGLSPKQPVLWQNVVAWMDATGSPDGVYDFPADLDTNGNGFADEAVGHGTFVTSIIATIAPHAQIVVAKVADSDGIASAWTVIKGIVFAVTTGCELANVSLGSPEQPAALGDVIEWASARGLTVVAGAGNDATDRALYPARFSDVVGVAGVDLKDLKSDFSNWDGHLRQAAPSVDIAGAWWEGGMVGWSGTSFAAPIVTGCLADTARRRAWWPPSRVLSLCDSTGVSIDSLNPAYDGELGLRVDWRLLAKKQGASTVFFKR